jgi:hypothetical protein
MVQNTVQTSFYRVFELQFSLKCLQLGNLCSSKRCTTFVLVNFEVFKRNLENASKALEQVN